MRKTPEYQANSVPAILTVIVAIFIKEWYAIAHHPLISMSVADLLRPLARNGVEVRYSI
jgi:hypothetical protein